MPIASVLLTDTLDQWRQKTNQMVDKVNSLGASGTILSVTSPVAGHIFVYDGTTFRNIAMTGDVLIGANGQTQIVSGAAGSLTKGRLAFAGATRSLY